MATHCQLFIPHFMGFKPNTILHPHTFLEHIPHKQFTKLFPDVTHPSQLTLSNPETYYLDIVQIYLDILSGLGTGVYYREIRFYYDRLYMPINYNNKNRDILFCTMTRYIFRYLIKLVNRLILEFMFYIKENRTLFNKGGKVNTDILYWKKILEEEEYERLTIVDRACVVFFILEQKGLGKGKLSRLGNRVAKQYMANPLLNTIFIPKTN